MSGQKTVKLLEEVEAEILQPCADRVDCDKMREKHPAFLSSLHSCSFALIMKKRLNFWFMQKLFKDRN